MENMEVSGEDFNFLLQTSPLITTPIFHCIMPNLYLSKTSANNSWAIDLVLVLVRLRAMTGVTGLRNTWYQITLSLPSLINWKSPRKSFLLKIHLVCPGGKMASVWKQMIQSIMLLAQKDEDKHGKKIHDQLNVTVYS